MTNDELLQELRSALAKARMMRAHAVSERLKMAIRKHKRRINDGGVIIYENLDLRDHV